MRWIEIITLQLAQPADASRLAAMVETVRSGEDESLRGIDLFRSQIDGDLAVHLIHQSENANPSVCGHRLGAAMRELGLVDHAIWVSFKKT